MLFLIACQICPICVVGTMFFKILKCGYESMVPRVTTLLYIKMMFRKCSMHHLWLCTMTCFRKWKVHVNGLFLFSEIVFIRISIVWLVGKFRFMECMGDPFSDITNNHCHWILLSSISKSGEKLQWIVWSAHWNTFNLIIKF